MSSSSEAKAPAPNAAKLTRNAIALELQDALRELEVLCVCGLLPPDGKILELGGGDGLQAKVLAKAGFQVTSIDIPSRSMRSELLFPVLNYDGSTIPFNDGSFDAVFSSNVLEHIPHLANSLAEIRRVLKVGGVAIHILPTPVWRFWTTLTHYPWLIRRALLRGRGAIFSGAPAAERAVEEEARPRSRWDVWRRALALGFAPHGEYPNAIAELYYFRRGTWVREFEANGFEVSSYLPTGLFYSGHLLVTTLPISTRRVLSRILGSSCAIFVTRASSAAL